MGMERVGHDIATDNNNIYPNVKPPPNPWDGAYLDKIYFSFYA